MDITDTTNFNYNSLITYSNEFFYDISFMDYDNINIKNFFYDISFEDYITNIKPESNILINL